MRGIYCFYFYERLVLISACSQRRSGGISVQSVLGMGKWNWPIWDGVNDHSRYRILFVSEMFEEKESGLK